MEILFKEFQLASFGCTKCGATHLDSGRFPRKKHTCLLCKLCEHRWLKSPVIGNPLAALGCWLEGAILYMGRVTVTAGKKKGLPNYVGCMSCDCRTVHVKVICQRASCFQGQSVALYPTHSQWYGEARGIPCDPSNEHMASMEVEST